MTFVSTHTRRLLLAASVLGAATAQAQLLVPSDPIDDDRFGATSSLSGNNAIFGAPDKDDNGSRSGSLYYFKNLDAATGTVTEDVKLTASDAASNAFFGNSVTLDGNNALIGANSANSNRGTVYLFRDLHTANNTTTEDVQLTASDAAIGDSFGISSSLSGNNAIAGTTTKSGSRGAAYYFKGLDTAGSAVTEDVKLTASDAATWDEFGTSTSLVGDNALVGAVGDEMSRGAAYYFKGLDAVIGSTATEDVKLTASDGKGSDRFGISTSLSGDNALVGSEFANTDLSGAAYYYKNLNNAGSTKTEDVKLTSSDASASDRFGSSISLSGDNALIGAHADDDGGAGSGSAYYFKNLDAAGSTATETLKFTASDASANDNFGWSVSLDGDRFVITAQGKNSGAGGAYTGTISSMTTLNVGNANRRIEIISFVSKDDWVVGETTDGNTVTLSAGSSATVNEAGKSVFIGRNAGSDNNLLVIEGNLTGNIVYVGSTAGNTGNTVALESPATFDLSDFYIANGNNIRIEGDYTDTTTLFAYFDDTTLQVENEFGNFEIATLANQGDLWDVIYDGTYTYLGVPEPATYALILGGLTLFGAILRKRFKA